MRALVIAAALTTAACGGALVNLPSGSGRPVDSARASAALMEASGACSSVRTLTAEVAVSGSTAGHRVRGRLSVGLASPASARLEAVSPFGPPLFIFVTAGTDATLLLPQDDRVLEHGQPDAVLDAVAGVPLDGAALVTTLTGCSGTVSARSGVQFGDQWLKASLDASDLYLRRDKTSSPWHVAATIHRAGGAGSGWRAEYGDREYDVPRTIRLVSLDQGGGSGRAFDMRLQLSQIDVNTPLGADVFSVQIPRTAMPITLDELRVSGPLNGR